MRFLRSYERSAEWSYNCDNCHGMIWSGDIYRGEVYVDQKKKSGRINVFKTHVFPECYHDPFDDEDSRDKDDGLDMILDEAA